METRLFLINPDNKVKLIKDIISYLMMRSIPVVLLRGFDDSSLRLCNDIDLFVPASHFEQAKQIILQYCNLNRLHTLPTKRHANLSFDLFLYRMGSSDEPVYLNIEVTTRMVHPLKLLCFSLDIPYMNTSAITSSCTHRSGIPILSDNHYLEHLFYLVKILKRQKYELEFVRLCSKVKYYKPDPNFAFSSDFAGLLSSCLSLSPESTSQSLKKNFITLLFNSYLKSISMTEICWQLSHLSIAIFDKIRHFIFPPGKFVIFQGPDGAGKTTVADIVHANLHSLTKRSIRLHLGNRPIYLSYRMLIRRPKNSQRESIVENAPKKIKYRPIPNNFLAIFYQNCRVILHQVDYLMDYFIRIRPLLVLGNTVLAERYFYDYSIIPARFPGAWPLLLHCLASILPRPDLAITLTHKNPQSFSTIKGELSPECFVFESSGYAKHGDTYCRSVTIENELNSLPKVAAKVMSQILNLYT